MNATSPLAASPRVRLVIFDFDGVLADTVADITAATNAVMRAHGLLPVPTARVRGLIGGGAEGVMERLMPGSDQAQLGAAAALFRTVYEHCYDRRTHLYPGVNAVLDRLRAAGLLMAVDSNKMELFTRALLGKLGIAESFAAVIGPESVRRSKPDPEGLQVILRRLEVSPAQALMVGDTAIDITAGQAAGVMTCVALYGYGDGREIHAAGPDYAISSIRELPALLRAIA